MPGPTTPLAEALAAWDREAHAADLAAAETQRAEVLERFPLAAWPDLPLERYALGTPGSTESFCYAMEFGTRNLGSMAGGSARKLLIYKRRDTGEWYFDRRFQSVDEAWTAVRAGFVRLFDAVAAGNIDAVGDLTPLDWAPALTIKAVSIYFPDAVLSIQSHAHLEHFWALLGGEGDIEWNIPGARQLRKLVGERPEFAGWSTREITSFLYDWAHPQSAARIVKIAPGPDGKLWDDCLANGYIRVGWEEAGDLRDFATKEEFRARFSEVFADQHSGQAKLNEKANEVWTLIELEPGDLVVANRGTSRILGVGTVVDPGYALRPELGNYANTVAVAWDTAQARDIPPIRRWAFKTVAPISEADYAKIMSGESARTAASRSSSPRRRTGSSARSTPPFGGRAR